MRRTATLTMIVIGIALMLTGYLASAPWGADTVADSNPRFDFSPTVFVIGVIFVFAAAVVYEVMPDRREK